MWTQLRLTVFHAELRSELKGRLPGFKGSTLRGALGHALKSVSCLEPGGGEVCRTCPRTDRCAAGALFDIAPVQGDHDRPVGYFLSLPPERREVFQAGDRLCFTLSLVGSARVWHPWIIAALAGLGWRGLAAERWPWSLTGLSTEYPVGQRTPVEVFNAGIGARLPELTGSDIVASQPYPASGSAVLRFVTPAHLQRGKRLVATLDGPTLVSRLLRRIGSLVESYEGWSARDFAFAPLIELAAQIRCKAQRLEPVAVDRYSNRHDTKHALTGLVGSVVLENIPPDLWPYLVLGQWTHVGKGATFGLGKYTLTAIEKLCSLSHSAQDDSAEGVSRPDVQSSPTETRVEVALQ